MSRPAEEVETFRVFANWRASWPGSRQIFRPPTRSRGWRFRFSTAEEVITCDNTHFIHTGRDADRSGIILSVPFFGEDGALRGAVSAIMLSSALTQLLSSDEYVLVNPGQD